MDVGIVLLIVINDRLDDLTWFLGGRGIVEID